MKQRHKQIVMAIAETLGADAIRGSEKGLVEGILRILDDYDAKVMAEDWRPDPAPEPITDTSPLDSVAILLDEMDSGLPTKDPEAWQNEAEFDIPGIQVNVRQAQRMAALEAGLVNPGPAVIPQAFNGKVAASRATDDAEARLRARK